MLRTSRYGEDVLSDVGERVAVVAKTKPSSDRRTHDAPSPGDAERQLRLALERALAEPSPAVRRLSYARTSVALSVNGGSEPTTLLLDRRPPVVGAIGEPAEIEIHLSPSQAVEFADGHLSLPGAILRGEVTHRGPVRTYMEVDPILRGLLAAGAQANGRGRNGHHSESGQTAAVISSDFDPSQLALETRDLHKSFGSDHILRGVNLRIPEGVVSVVLGPSGTGKSVLLRHVIGLLRPDSGDVVVRGRPLSKMSRSQILALRTEIGVMFQDGALFSMMNLYDNVAFPLRQHTKLKEKEIREVVMDHLTRVGLANAASRMPNQLSGGMRKRAGLARALVLDPGVVLCDEPDSGLDPVRTALLGELLIEQHAQMGGTILVITHDVDLAQRISDHISILWQGKVIEAEMTETILNSGNDFVRQFLNGETDGPLGMD
jgi:phospholipid/cholesterol/gamma-HCH transport system ATP-binding protein